MARINKSDSEHDNAADSNTGNSEPATNVNAGSDAVGGDELQQSNQPDNEHVADTGHDPLAGIDSGTGTGTGTRKTGGGKQSGRKIAGTGGRSKTAQTVDIKGAGRKALALQIAGLHEMAGIMTGQKELCCIDQDQAEMLVLAVQNVMSQYKIKPNPKVMAWCELVGVAAMIYAPKIMILREMRKMHAQARRAEPAPERVNEPAPPGMMQFV